MAGEKSTSSDAILVTTSQFEKPFSEQGDRPIRAGEKGPSATILVNRRDRRRTADKHGLSSVELATLGEAAHYLKSFGPAVWIVVGCHGENDRQQRKIIRAVKQLVATYQRRADIRPLFVEVLEGEPELHANIVASMPNVSAANDLIERLERSERYGSRLNCQRVTDWNLPNYLAKEATPQAHYKKTFRRIPKAERTGTVLGDRVRPSRALEAALIRRGQIEPRRRTYAARKPNRVSKDKPININGLTELNCCIFNGLPVENNSPEQLSLPLAAPPVIDLFAQAEAKRKAAGIPQHLVARRLGIRQSHWSNSIVRRHDTLSPWAINRVREYVAGELAV